MSDWFNLAVPQSTEYDMTPLPGLAEMQSFQGLIPTGQDFEKTKYEWENVLQSPEYIYGSETDKTKLTENFANTFTYGKAVLNERYGYLKGGVENIYDITRDSFKAALKASQLAPDVVTGEIDTNVGEILSQHHQDTLDAYTPRSLRETHEALRKMQEDYVQAEGFGETAGALTSAGWEVLKQVFGNPEGVLQLTAQSAGNIAPIVAGGIGGSLAAGPVGGIAGTFAGGFTVEAGHRLIEEANKELAKQKLEPTKENYQSLFENANWTGEAIRKSRLKAAGTAAVDTVLSMGTAKVMSLPFRRAEKAARLVADPSKVGHIAYERALATELSKISSVDKLTSKFKGLMLETASEPISEFAGQKAAGDATDIGELAGELLGGIGSSGATAAASKAAFSTKIATTLPFALYSDARSSAKHKDLVTSLIDTEDLSVYTDPNKTEYNPLAVIDVLAERSKKEGLTQDKLIDLRNQARDLKQTLKVQSEQIVTETIPIVTKYNKDPNSITAEEQKIYDHLVTRNNDIVKVVRQIDQHITAWSPQGKEVDTTIDQNITEAIDQADSAKVQEAIIESFGSKGRVSSDIIETLSGVETSDAFSPEVKSFVKNVIGLEVSREKLSIGTESVGKATGEVQQDVFAGIDEFKGIDAFIEEITVAINTGNTEKATTELNNLISFYNKQKSKQNSFNQAIDAIDQGKEIPTDVQQYIDDLSQQRTNQGLSPYDVTTVAFSEHVLKNLNTEVTALAQTVQAMGQMFQSKEISHGIDLTKHEVEVTKIQETEQKLEDTLTGFSEQKKQAKQNFFEKLYGMETKLADIQALDADPAIILSEAQQYSLKNLPGQVERLRASQSIEGYTEFKASKDQLAPESQDRPVSKQKIKETPKTSSKKKSTVKAKSEPSKQVSTKSTETEVTEIDETTTREEAKARMQEIETETLTLQKILKCIGG